MQNRPSELDRFIEKFCDGKISRSIKDFISADFDTLDLTHNSHIIDKPESASLYDSTLKFTYDVKIKGSVVSFTAVYECTIVIEQTIRHETESDYADEWISVSCEMRITDKLEKFDVTDISVYSRKAHPNRENRATADFVPVISRAQLENEAMDFLVNYCVEVFDKPMPVPIENIIKDKMRLGLVCDYQLTPNLSLFGMLCFSEGDIEVYQNINEPVDIHIGGSTVFVDPYVSFLRNIGCMHNTMAHEAYHWHRHRIYATIRSMLNGEKHIANRCATEPTGDALKDSFQTPTDWMEWQANWVAPKILMPLQTVTIKAKELVEKYGYTHKGVGRLEAMRHMIDDLAEFYRVSKQSARIRLMEIGYEDAFHVYNYSEKAPEIRYTISPNDAFDEYLKNKEFQKTIDSGIFTYVGNGEEGSFVINHPSAIESMNGKLCLTDLAQNNLAMYALQFTDADAYYHFYYSGYGYLKEDGALYKKNPDNKHLSRYNQNRNSETIQRGENLTAIIETIATQYESGEDSDITFCKIVTDKMEKKGWDYKNFMDNTLLNASIYYAIIKNKQRNTSLSTVIAICIGLGLNITDSEYLLSLCGYRLRNTIIDSAYRCILMYANLGIDYCNSILANYGIPELGSQVRK
jgi:hypothetical protein